MQLLKQWYMGLEDPEPILVSYFGVLKQMVVYIGDSQYLYETSRQNTLLITQYLHHSDIYHWCLSRY